MELQELIDRIERWKMRVADGAPAAMEGGEVMTAVTEDDNSGEYMSDALLEEVIAEDAMDATVAEANEEIEEGNDAINDDAAEDVSEDFAENDVEEETIGYAEEGAFDEALIDEEDLDLESDEALEKQEG